MERKAMKCIIRSASLTLTPGRPERVSNEEAWREVEAGRAVYTSKEAWRKQRDAEKSNKKKEA